MEKALEVAPLTGEVITDEQEINWQEKHDEVAAELILLRRAKHVDRVEGMKLVEKLITHAAAVTPLAKEVQSALVKLQGEVHALIEMNTVVDDESTVEVDRTA